MAEPCSKRLCSSLNAHLQNFIVKTVISFCVCVCVYQVWSQKMIVCVFNILWWSGRFVMNNCQITYTLCCLGSLIFKLLYMHQSLLQTLGLSCAKLSATIFGKEPVFLPSKCTATLLGEDSKLHPKEQVHLGLLQPRIRVT